MCDVQRTLWHNSWVYGALSQQPLHELEEEEVEGGCEW